MSQFQNKEKFMEERIKEFYTQWRDISPQVKQQLVAKELFELPVNLSFGMLTGRDSSGSITLEKIPPQYWREHPNYEEMLINELTPKYFDSISFSILPRSVLTTCVIKINGDEYDLPAMPRGDALMLAAYIAKRM